MPTIHCYPLPLTKLGDLIFQPFDLALQRGGLRSFGQRSNPLRERVDDGLLLDVQRLLAGGNGVEPVGRELHLVERRQPSHGRNVGAEQGHGFQRAPEALAPTFEVEVYFR